MGLDQYAFTRRIAPAKEVDFFVENESREDEAELHYWRKHPNLHGWMEQLYVAKGGAEESFNVTPVVLTNEDLDSLEKAVLNEHLPETEGFFFGVSSPDDREDDLAFIMKARAAITDGLTVYYYAWW